MPWTCPGPRSSTASYTSKTSMTRWRSVTARACGPGGAWIITDTNEFLTIDAFFFSSRRRHTRLQGDWSSDVCSSDLLALPDQRQTFDRDRQLTPAAHIFEEERRSTAAQNRAAHYLDWAEKVDLKAPGERSEERRVGKECRSRWSPYH